MAIWTCKRPFGHVGQRLNYLCQCVEGKKIAELELACTNDLLAMSSNLNNWHSIKFLYILFGMLGNLLKFIFLSYMQWLPQVFLELKNYHN